jgi:hypothetical protein
MRELTSDEIELVAGRSSTNHPHPRQAAGPSAGTPPTRPAGTARPARGRRDRRGRRGAGGTATAGDTTGA